MKRLVILAALLVSAAPFFARHIPAQNLKVDVDRQRADVQIFSIGAGGSINNVVEITGGYAFHGSARPFMGLNGAYKAIAAELKNEYVIGYRSTNTTKDSRWRQIRVKVDAQSGLSDVKVRAKKGYYPVAK